MTIMLSGKITGDPNYKEKFKKAKKEVEQLYPGVVVISPTDINMCEFAWKEAMDITITILHAAKCVYFLNDWKKSKGATIEHEIAEMWGYKMLYESE